MPIDTIYAIVEQAFFPDKSGTISHVELMDKNGLLLYSRNNRKGVLKERGGDWEYIKGLIRQGGCCAAVQHDNGQEEEITAYAMEHGFSDYNGQGWILTICAPVETAFAPARVYGKRFVILLAAISLLVLLITSLTSRAALRPLARLSAAATEIGSGNLDETEEVRSNDEVGRLAAAFNDMTLNLKKSRAELAERERFLANILNSIQDGLSVLDEEFRIVKVNPTMARVFSEKMPLAGRKCHDAYHGRTEPCDSCPSMRTLATGRPEVEVFTMGADGDWVWLELSTFPLFDEGRSRVTGVIEYIRNITDRKRMEDELRESEEKFRSLFNAANDGILLHDFDLRILDVNDKFCEQLGYGRDELLEMTRWEFSVPKYAKRIANNLEEIRRNGGAIFETAHVTRDCKVLPTEMSVSIIDYKGMPAMLAVARDISERKSVETERLRRGTMLARLDSTLVSLARDEKLFAADLRAAFETITEAAARALEVERVSIWFLTPGHAALKCMDLFERVQGRHTSGVLRDASDFSSYFKALDEEYIAAGEAVTDPRTREFADSHLKPLGIAAMLDVPIRRGGKVVGVVCHEHIGFPRPWNAEEQSFVNAIAGFASTAIEIQGRKKAEEKINRLNEELEFKVEERTRQLLNAQGELVRKERLSALGQIAGSVGHELRNPLGVMSNAVYFLQTVLTEADEQTREYLGIIMSEIKGAERIVTDLLDAVRTKSPRPQRIPAKELIRASVEKCRIPDNLQVDVKAETPVPVQVDPFQIGQAFINLINNATDAMPEGGSLRITTEDDHAAHAVRFTFRDEGAGIAAGNMERLFQPLFTTKPRGIGLGLVVVKNLIEANGGKIEVESELGEGSTFRVILPMAGQ